MLFCFFPSGFVFSQCRPPSPSSQRWMNLGDEKRPLRWECGLGWSLGRGEGVHETLAPGLGCPCLTPFPAGCRAGGGSEGVHEEQVLGLLPPPTPLPFSSVSFLWKSRNQTLHLAGKVREGGRMEARKEALHS